MLSPYWPYILLVIILVVLGIVLGIYLLLRRARTRAVAAQSRPVPAAAAPVGFIQQTASSSIGLKTSFARSLRALRGHVTRRDYRYRLPWFLLVGEEQSGKTTLLAESGMNLPLGRPSEHVYGVRQALNWFFFDRAVVLDVAGELVLRSDCETSNGRGWATLSRLLQKHRPERPLDGVVLTIPCSDLIAGRGLAPDQRARVEQKAVCLYRKLWQAQKQLGMSFPVYVIVTKCDEVPGFQSFSRELPTRMREEMFGWSAPYTLETAYRPEWVGEAFQNVYRYLFQSQVEVLAERGDIEDRDGIFLLPSEMQQLRAPLQLYLDQIFKESSFHDSFFFRGLYFCGDAGEDTATAALLPVPSVETASAEDWTETSPDPFAPPAATLEAPQTRRPAFVRDLFEKKIFLEDMLARPLIKARLSRNRTVFAAQVLSLAIPIIGCAGLLVTYAGLERRRDELQELLSHEEQDLNEVKALRGGRNGRPHMSDFYDDYYRQSSYEPQAAPRRAAVYADAALGSGVGGPATATPLPDVGAPPEPSEDATHDNEQHLLTAMSKVGGRRYYSVFIPSSWFSDLNERTRESMVSAFQYVILEGMRLGLDERTESFLQAAPIEGGFSSVSPAPQTVPGSYIAPAAGTRGPSPLYDQSYVPGDDGTLHGFIEHFTELRANRALYEGLIREGSGSLEDLKSLATYLGHNMPPEGFDTNNELYKEALRQARGRPLAVRSADVQRAVAAKVAEMTEVLYQRSFERQTSAVSFGYLNDIAQTEALLQRPEYTWLSTYVFDARSSFHEMTLSSGLRELRVALEGLSRESFMAGGAGGVPRVPPLPRRQLVWDGEMLRRAVALCADYERFTSGRGEYSKNLDDSVREAALAQLKAKVSALVAGAQHYQPAPPAPGEAAMLAGLDAEVRSLEATQEPLGQLLAATDRLSIDSGLRTALASQLTYLLEAVDGQFQSERFYTMARPNFSWWDGAAKPIAPVAFGADSTDDLASYLAAQRKRITHLARDMAAPVFNFAAAQNVPVRPARVDWGELLATLSGYDDKQPGNSLSVLEGFILSGMDKVDVDRCQEFDGGADVAPSRDFFIRRRNYLRALLKEQCNALAAARTKHVRERDVETRLLSLSNYSQIADKFNKTLAGRFPFGEAEGSPYVEADPEAVVAFFTLLDQQGEAARDALRANPQLGAQGDAAWDFLDRMDKVRAFFSGYLDKKTGPALDFNVEFRVNREHEDGAGQIMDWTLDVGNTKYRYLGKELTGRWVIGEPVRLTLRWAGNSPVMPYSASESPNFKARDRIAVFEYKNRWSLLSMMLRQRPSPGDFSPYGVDLAPYSLKFRIPTRPGGNAFDSQPEGLRSDEARVFMRVSLLAPGAKEPLVLPEFPARAPGL
ncbi:MAG: type secretion system protein ImpL [Acidobacteriota bacterium]|nr:type secretion system protein ImpL [Acidobacteriota bacterium]